MDIEKENKIISSIYESAICPENWVNVLEEIVAYTQSHAAIFTALDQLNPSADFVYSYNLPAQAIEAYQDEQIKVIDMDLHAALWQNVGLGTTLEQDMRHYATSQNSNEYIFYEKCLAPAGVSRLAGVLLERGEYQWAILGIHRAPDMPKYSDEIHDFLRRIGVHLRRSLQIYKQLSSLNEANRDLHQLLNHLKVGLVLLDHKLALTYANDCAQGIIRGSSCLNLDQYNHLKVSKQHELDELLHRTLYPHHHPHEPIGGVLSISDQEGHSIMLSVMPFVGLQAQSSQHQIALVITDQQVPYRLPFLFLKQKYQLSKREFQQCELLVNGYKFEEIATELGISLNSVRTYFKYIYEKTNVSSQIELMHLLMGCTLQFEHIA